MARTAPDQAADGFASFSYSTASRKCPIPGKPDQIPPQKVQHLTNRGRMSALKHPNGLSVMLAMLIHGLAGLRGRAVLFAALSFLVASLPSCRSAPDNVGYEGVRSPMNR